MTWGGERTPANPAAVSGPGAHSARTDGGVMDPNSPSYGEGAELESMAQAAPMGGAPAPAGPVGAGGALPSVTGLGAPGEAGLPVTAGAALGAGDGPEALGLPMDPISEDRADVAALDPGMVQAMLAYATSERATPSFKRRVREILAAR